MKQSYKTACAIILLMLGAGASAFAQTQPSPTAAAPAAAAPAAAAPEIPSDDTDLAPGFKLRTTGGLDISDMYLEVVHFDDNWKEVEEHDIFQPTVTTPTTQPSSKVLTGDFPVGGGTFKLTEQLDPTDAGVHFSATMSSEKAIPTNEMSVGINLQVATFGGKEIKVDGEAVPMPAAPAPKGDPHIFDKDGVKEVDLPTPAGTLIITGDNLSVLVQDDREWGDQRYGLRIHFNPSDGQITSSKIDLQLKWKPAEK